MSDKAKDIRKQVRNVIKETFPVLLSQELAQAVYKSTVSALQTHYNGRIDELEGRIKTLTLHVLKQQTSIKPAKKE